MRCKAIFLALLALVFEAQARFVSSDEAAHAARVWAKSHGFPIIPRASATPSTPDSRMRRTTVSAENRSPHPTTVKSGRFRLTATYSLTSRKKFQLAVP